MTFEDRIFGRFPAGLTVEQKADIARYYGWHTRALDGVYTKLKADFDALTRPISEPQACNNRHARRAAARRDRRVRG